MPANQLGSLMKPCELWDHQAILNALALVDSDPWSFLETCKNLRIKPIFRPFFVHLPYTDIFQAITPDILHQLHQGVLKHLLSWLVQAYGASEINARVQHLIPNHHIQIFSSGITNLSQVTGKVRNLISWIVLGVIIGARIVNDLEPWRMVQTVCAFLDFLYLARLPLQMTTTLSLLRWALHTFHENMAIFINLGIWQNFNIPKIHACQHYESSIRLFGSTDNYNTQYTEHLHKDFSKKPSRATNMRDELPQMAVWLERQEQVHQHARYIHWLEQGGIQAATTWGPIPNLKPHCCTKMSKEPTVYSVSIKKLETDYGMSRFQETFAQFVVQWQQPQVWPARLDYKVQGIHLPFISVSTYHRIKFLQASANGDRESVADIIHIQPAHIVTRQRNASPKTVNGWFDTVLVHSGKEGDTGVWCEFMPFNATYQLLITHSSSCSTTPCSF